jgi:hypothetical protein
MARPTQNTIDYFSHDCNHKQTMYILENKYKNDGYAFWFKLLESLGSAPNHFLDLNDEIACEFLAAKTNLSWSSCDEILTLLAKINAICPELWSKKIVWCQNFVDRLSGVYAKRKKQIPNKPSFCDGNDSITVFSGTETPQSKLNEIKENKSNNPTNFDNNGLPPELDKFTGKTFADYGVNPQDIQNALGQPTMAVKESERPLILALLSEDCEPIDFKEALNTTIKEGKAVRSVKYLQSRIRDARDMRKAGTLGKKPMTDQQEKEERIRLETLQFMGYKV